MKFGERSVSVLSLTLCAVWLLYSRKIATISISGAPGPNFFPFIIVGVLACLTILKEALSFRELVREKKAGSPVRDKKAAVEGSPRDEEIPDRKKTVFSFILIFLFVAGIDTLGFYPSTVITVFAALKFIMRITIRPALISTAVITGSVFVIFTLFFQLPLPRGIF
jgi:hypothetical protein